MREGERAKKAEGNIGCSGIDNEGDDGRGSVNFIESRKKIELKTISLESIISTAQRRLTGGA